MRIAKCTPHQVRGRGGGRSSSGIVSSRLVHRLGASTDCNRSVRQIFRLRWFSSVRLEPSRQSKRRSLADSAIEHTKGRRRLAIPIATQSQAAQYDQAGEREVCWWAWRAGLCRRSTAALPNATVPAEACLAELPNLTHSFATQSNIVALEGWGRKRDTLFNSTQAPLWLTQCLAERATCGRMWGGRVYQTS